ncbi:MAG: YceI family protein [Woeseiaceae bacterium]
MSWRLICLACCSTMGLFPDRAVPADDAVRYRVVAGESELAVLVFRAGALGRFAHNHVISSNGITGTVLVGDTPADSSLDLTLNVDSLEVDDPEARADAGSVFEGTVDEKDIEGTRGNMLSDKLLDADRYKEIRIVSSGISGEFSDMTVDAQITIKGEQHNVELPVNAIVYGDRIVATGRTDISHSELGLSPFTAGFGTLSVAEDMTFRYRIVAVRE